MQNHRLWIVDGLLIGGITLATSGLAGWVKLDQVGAAIAGGTIGGGIATYVNRRRPTQEPSELDEKLEAILQDHKNEIAQQLQKLRTEIAETLTELKPLPQLQDSTQSEPETEANRDPKPTDIDLSTEIPNPSPAIAPLPNTSKAIAWLSDRGVTVTPDNSTPSPETEKALNQLASMLGKHYSSLHELYTQLKQNAKEGIPFHFSLKDRTQQDIQINTSFAAKLKQFGFLADHHYTKKVLRLQPHRQQDFRDFITGKWFERFIHDNVTKILRSRKLPYECLLNRTVIFPNGDRCELDLFYWVAGHPIWIECKTGNNYDECLEEYSKRGGILGVPKSQAFMVVLKISPSYAKIRTEGWGITVTDQDTLLDALNDCLNQIAPPKTAIVPPSSPTLTANPEGSPLEAVRMKPCPENRHRVLAALVDLLADPDYEPKTVNQLNPILREQLHESARKINWVQVGSINAGLFYDPEERLVGHPNQPIARLLYQDVDLLERQFIETYAREVLAIDPTFFDQPENIECYEQYINGKAPDVEAIARLKQALNPEAR